MKTLSLTAAVILSVVFCSCSKSNSSPTTTSTSLVGSWTLVSNAGTGVDSATTPITTIPFNTTYTAGEIVLQINSNNTNTTTNNSTSPATVVSGTYSISGNTAVALVSSGNDKFSGTYAISGSTLTIMYNDSEPGESSSSGTEVYTRE